MNKSQFTLQEINELDQPHFVEALGRLFEGPPWIVEQAWQDRPFPSGLWLLAMLRKRMYAAPLEQQIALLQAHPDLVGQAALAGTLTPESTHEQAAAGLHALSPQDLETFQSLNSAYRKRFGFPFIMCVRTQSKESILASITKRLRNYRPGEIDRALEEVSIICALRLNDIILEE